MGNKEKSVWGLKPNTDWYKAESDAPVYNKKAVDKEINRSKQKIGSSEAKAIHSLLKGRHAKGGKINTAEHKNPKHKEW